MHAAQREQLIIEMLVERGFVSFPELDKRIDASPATIRRDLEKLENSGRIIRVRGGARLARAEDVEPDAGHLRGVPFHENLSRNRPAKEAIGRAAGDRRPVPAVPLPPGLLPHLRAHRRPRDRPGVRPDPVRPARDGHIAGLATPSFPSARVA